MEIFYDQNFPSVIIYSHENYLDTLYINNQINLIREYFCNYSSYFLRIKYNNNFELMTSCYDNSYYFSFFKDPFLTQITFPILSVQIIFM